MARLPYAMSFPAPPRLLFRADGDATIGLGHVVRLLALADMLRGLAAGHFLLRDPSTAVQQLIRAEGWGMAALPATRSLSAEASWLATDFLHAQDIVMVDGYNFDDDYQQRLRGSGCGLVAIDDLQAWPVLADVLINHSPGVTPADYRPPGTTQFLLGPAFSLLRRPFLEAAVPPRFSTSPSKALVCFGGADPLRLTERSLRALLQLPQVQAVTLVVGGAFGDPSALQQLAAQHPTRAISIRQNVAAPVLVELLQQHDVALVPASTVLIEALVLGCPAITGYYADNQRYLADYVQAQGQAVSVGDFGQLTDAQLAAALRHSWQQLAAKPQLPYVAQLRPDLLRDAVAELLRSQQ